MKRFLSFLLAVIFLMGFMASGTSCTALLLTALISNYSAQEDHDISGKVEHSENIWFDPMPDTEKPMPDDEKDEHEEQPIPSPDKNGNGIPDFEEDKNGNGIPDFEEDKNGNGIPDFEDPEIDENMNGIPDIKEDPSSGENGEDKVERPENGLLSGEQFTLDGDLSDFRKYSESALMIQGIDDNACPDSLNKCVYFYGVMTEMGMFVACEAYHNLLDYGDPNLLFDASSFILLLDGREFFTVSAVGDDQFDINGTGIQAYMKTEELESPTNYRTVAEMFISAYDLEFYEIYPDSTDPVDICLAWVTPEDVICYEYNSTEIVTSDVWEIPRIELTRYGIYCDAWGH